MATTAVGDPEAPVLLFGHGVGSSSRFILDALAPPLVQEGWQVIAHDLRGHGRSTPCTAPTDYALPRLVADVAAMVESFRPRVVAGVSLSGHVAVQYAAGAGVGLDGVVACLPAWSGASIPGEGPHAVVADTVDEVGVDVMVERFASDEGIRPWLRHVLVRDWPIHEPASLRAALRSLDSGVAPTTDTIAGLPVPLGVVAWPDDPGHPLEVARVWADTAPIAVLADLTLADLDDDLTAFGRAAATALQRLGLLP